MYSSVALRCSAAIISDILITNYLAPSAFFILVDLHVAFCSALKFFLQFFQLSWHCYIFLPHLLLLTGHVCSACLSDVNVSQKAIIHSFSIFPLVYTCWVIASVIMNLNVFLWLPNLYPAQSLCWTQTHILNYRLVIHKNGRYPTGISSSVYLKSWSFLSKMLFSALVNEVTLYSPKLEDIHS